MSNAPVPSISLSSRIVRLLIAFILGLQLGLIVFIPASLPWLFPGPVITLLVAMLLSILLDPQVRQGALSSQRVRTAIFRVLLVIVAPLLGLIVLGTFLPTLGFLVLAVIALAVSVMVAFTVGSGTILLALGTGMIAWSGAGILFLAAASIQAGQPGNDLGSLVFGVIAFLVFLGFGVAASGGLAGRLLRRWALG